MLTHACQHRQHEAQQAGRSLTEDLQAHPIPLLWEKAAQELKSRSAHTISLWRKRMAHRKRGQGSKIWADALPLHGVVEVHSGAGLLDALTGGDEGVVDVQRHGDPGPLHARPHSHGLLPVTLQTAPPVCQIREADAAQAQSQPARCFCLVCTALGMQTPEDQETFSFASSQGGVAL